MYNLLSPAQVRAIKASLWYGDLRESIAAEYECSVQTIHQIAQGTRHSEVAWPDGALGALPGKRAKLIIQARRQAKEAAQGSMSARVKALLKELEQT